MENTAQKEDKNLKTKQEKTEILRDKLLCDLMQGQTKTMIQKVAYILNYHREARNSDRALTLHFFKTFHPDFIDEDGKLSVEDLLKLPKPYDMQRMRAKIQNDYKIFLADPEIQARRAKLSEKAREALVSSGPLTSKVVIFADESGKTDDYLVFGSFWLYTESEWNSVGQKFRAWRVFHNTTKEFSFKDTSKHDQAKQAFSFFKEPIAHSPLNSFFVLIVKNKGIPQARSSTAIYDGFAEMVINGIQSEFKARRISPPIEIIINKDSDRDSDHLELAKMERRISAGLRDVFPEGEATLSKVEAPESSFNDLVQIADLFTGTVSRWINQGVPDPEGNPKNLLAHSIGEFFGFGIEDSKLCCTGDNCQITYLLDELRTVNK